MSRVDELKHEAEILRCTERMYESKAKDARMEAQKVEDELAALKAESHEPREFNMFLSPAGYLVPMKYFMQSLGKGGMVECAPITAIEKKPIVVTQALADDIYQTGMAIEGTATELARKLNNHGIDAIVEARAGDD